MKQKIILLLILIILAGCQASGGGPADGGIISGHTPVDNKFTLTTTMNKTYLVTETINLILNFPKAVVVAGGTPTIDITLGATVRTVPMSSGDGTSTLTFSYVVVPGDDDLDGISVSATLNKNGATIKYDTTYDTTSDIAVPNLSTVNVNTIAGTPPVAANITPASFDEDTQSIMTLSYSDADSDLATSCAISAPVKVTVTQACACAAGICTVGVTGTTHSNGAASFSYTVTANSQISNAATSTFSMNPVADIPVAANITPAAFNEDTQSVITLSYTDGDGDQATSCNISSPTSVTVTQACACAAGVCTVGVTGISNYSGAASFNYTVTANAQTSNSALATLTITAIGDAPIAANLTPAAFNEDIQSVITLSYTDAESNLATVCTISSPTNVTVTQACACAAGTCTVGVTGTSNYNGAASFAYTVTANAQVSNSATATLTINAIDDAPVSANITPAAFNENTQSVITLSYSDVELHSATVCSISSPTNVTVTQPCACAAGTCTVGVTGTLNYSGPASFLYTVTANGLISNSATATLTINSTASAPVASNISPAAFNEDTESLITLSYTDANSDLATSCAIAGLTNVTVSTPCACSVGVCSVGITGTTNYNGAASFTYTVTANAEVSNSATATLTIAAVDDAPVAANITPAAFNENTQSIITLSYTDVDPDLATACTISDETNVTVTQACACAAGTCTVGVTGTSNYFGAASLNYTVTANAVISNSASATLTIIDVNDPPLAANITPSAFNEDIQSIITLSYTDAESDQATSCSLSSLSNVSITQACACAAGTCTVGVTGSLNYNGAASFDYTVTANTQTSNTATATLSITPVADAPVAINITPAAFNEDAISNITLAYSDAEGDLATSCAVSGLTNVTVTTACSCVVGTCTVSVTGSTNYNGTASFDYTVTANSQTSNSATASLTISSVEDAAVATNTTPTAFNEDTQSIITLPHTDVDSQSTSCSITSPTNVTVTQACACAAGVCTVGVTGTANYFGAASFAFTVSSNSVSSNSANATLTINSVNDNPTISAIGAQSTNRNTPTASIAFTINDVDSTLACNATRLSMTSSDTSVVTNSSVTFSGTAPNCAAVIDPVTNASGTTTITFDLNDGAGGTASTNFNLTVNYVLLVWTNGSSTITSHDFGTPGATTTFTAYIKNEGNTTSDAVVVTDDAGSNKISQSNSCTTIAPGVSCPVVIQWDNTGGGGPRSEVYTATANGSSPQLTVTGVK